MPLSQRHSLHPEVGGSEGLRYVGTLPQHYTSCNLQDSGFNTSPQWRPQISVQVSLPLLVILILYLSSYVFLQTDEFCYITVNFQSGEDAELFHNRIERTIFKWNWYFSLKATIFVFINDIFKSNGLTRFSGIKREFCRTSSNFWKIIWSSVKNKVLGKCLYYISNRNNRKMERNWKKKRELWNV
jgi:hypothetical protein